MSAGVSRSYIVAVAVASAVPTLDIRLEFRALAFDEGKSVPLSVAKKKECECLDSSLSLERRLRRCFAKEDDQSKLPLRRREHLSTRYLP